MLPKKIESFLTAVKREGHVIRYGTVGTSDDGNAIYSGFIKVPTSNPDFLRNVLLQCDMINLDYMDEDVFEFLGVFPQGGAVQF